MADVPPDSNLEEYRDIFVKVRSLTKFCKEDIEDNDIHDVRLFLPVQDDDVSQQDVLPEGLPDYLTTHERITESKPSLDPKWMCSPSAAALQSDSGPYFELLENSIADEESHKTTRHAKLREVVHTTFITSCDWERLWEANVNSKPPLKKHVMNMVFFGPLACTVQNGMEDARQ
ncbi:hypothetical protein BC826DRAFT_1014882 [Russula brevipes]|nr:hypothetical protein BC826DRAFT_1014882 [Russula brevipes]